MNGGKLRPEKGINLPDTNLQISALTEKDIKARQIQSISDVVRQTPNVNFGSISYGTQLSSRGIGTSLVTGLGDSSVAVYLDGILLSRPAMASLLQKDLSRVELLRGPQGTLYGRNATGGVLNLITPDAPKSMQGGFTVGGGNYDSFRATADVGGPLGDRVRGRLFLNTESHEGYTKNISGGKPLDAQRTVGARATIDADRGSRTRPAARSTNRSRATSLSRPQSTAWIPGAPARTRPMSSMRRSSWCPTARTLTGSNLGHLERCG